MTTSAATVLATTVMLNGSYQHLPKGHLTYFSEVFLPVESREKCYRMKVYHLRGTPEEITEVSCDYESACHSEPRKAREDMQEEKARTATNQNHRMFGVGRALCGSSSPTPLQKQGHLQQAAQDLVQAGLEYPRGESTTSLGSLFQGSVTLMFRRNFLCFSLSPLPLVLSLGTTEQSLVNPVHPSCSALHESH